MVADETRITLEANPYYVWHIKGQTPVKRKRLEIHKGRTIFGALSMKTGKILCHTSQHKKAQGAVQLLAQIKRFKERYYSRGRILLIWDNVACHKSQEIKEWLRNNPGQIELDNFPPYSPEMNPIEPVWKTLKKEVNHLRGETTLTEIMQEASRFLKNNTFNYKLLDLTKFRIFK